jgi:hypothetical protein
LLSDFRVRHVVQRGVIESVRIGFHNPGQELPGLVRLLEMATYLGVRDEHQGFAERVFPVTRATSATNSSRRAFLESVGLSPYTWALGMFAVPTLGRAGGLACIGFS